MLICVALAVVFDAGFDSGLSGLTAGLAAGDHAGQQFAAGVSFLVYLVLEVAGAFCLNQTA